MQLCEPLLMYQFLWARILHQRGINCERSCRRLFYSSLTTWLNRKISQFEIRIAALGGAVSILGAIWPVWFRFSYDIAFKCTDILTESGHCVWFVGFLKANYSTGSRTACGYNFGYLVSCGFDCRGPCPISLNRPRANSQLLLKHFAINGEILCWFSLSTSGYNTIDSKWRNFRRGEGGFADLS